MKKKLIFSIALAITFVSIVSTISGQTRRTTDGPSLQAKSADAQIIKDRFLLVVLTGNPDFDQKIKEVVNKYWKLSKKIDFINSNGLTNKLAGNESKYSVLLINEIEITNNVQGNNNLIIGTYQNQYIRFSIKLGENLDNKKAIFYQNVAYAEDDRRGKTKVKLIQKEKPERQFNVDKKEILFALDFIQNHLIARIEGKKRLTFAWEAIENSGQLETKTLLIAKQDIDEKITEQDIQNNYPYKYKIADLVEVENAYLSRNKDFAFVEIAPLGYAAGVMTHYIVSCENGQIISFGEQHNGAFDKYSNWVCKDHLKAYVKNSNRGKKK